MFFLLLCREWFHRLHLSIIFRFVDGYLNRSPHNSNIFPCALEAIIFLKLFRNKIRNLFRKAETLQTHRQIRLLGDCFLQQTFLKLFRVRFCRSRNIEDATIRILSDWLRNCSGGRLSFQDG